MIDSTTVIGRYIAALQRGDLPTVRDSFAEDATWRLGGALPISGHWRGRDAIVDEFLGGARSFFEPGSVQIEVTELFAEGEKVSLEWTSRARTAAGEPYENQCAGVFTVRDGRIQAVREYMDTHYAYRAVCATA